jgi:hypothetical protein
MGKFIGWQLSRLIQAKKWFTKEQHINSQPKKGMYYV